MSEEQTQQPIAQPENGHTRTAKIRRRYWKHRFLTALAQHGNVWRAAESAQIRRQRAYELREKDAKFAALWEQAMEEAIERMEAECHRRAFEGEQTEDGKRYSDTLAIFLLKSHRPERYRERYEAQLTHPLLDAAIARLAQLESLLNGQIIEGAVATREIGHTTCEVMSLKSLSMCCDQWG